MDKRVISIGVISLFFIVNMFLLRSNLALKRLAAEEKAGFDQKLKAESESVRSEVKEDLEEKYRADIVSYRAMAKRMELERETLRKLKGEIAELKQAELESKPR